MIQKTLSEIFGEPSSIRELDSTALLERIETHKLLVATRKIEIEGTLGVRLKKRKSSTIELVKLIKKMFEDYSNNFEEYLHIKELTTKIKRQYWANPKNKEFEVLLKKSKQSVKNNLSQRQMIGRFLSEALEDIIDNESLCQVS